MHELGIMSGVMDSVQQAANDAGAQRVLKISLSVGEMTEAIEDALRFAFEALAEGTMCEDAELEITMIPPKSICRNVARNMNTTVFTCCARNAEVLFRSFCKGKNYALTLLK